MRAVIFNAPGNLSIDEVADPQIERPGDAIVRVTLAALCGSDVAAYWGPNRSSAVIFGHEFTGVVEAVGGEVKDLRAGQRVVSPGSVACGGCFYCKQGISTACEQLQAFGRDLPGALATYIRVPNADATLEPVPDDVPDERAIFVSHLLSGVFGALEAGGVHAGSSVAVLGCGPTGLATVLVARTMGAGRIFAIDHHAYRLEAAASLGAIALNSERDDIPSRVREATDGRGADIVVEAAASANALAAAVPLVRARGTVLSLSTDLDADAALPVGVLTSKQARFVPAASPPAKNYMRDLLKMLARGVLDPAPLVSHTVTLDEVPHALDLMSRRAEGVLKVLVRP